MLIQAPLSCYFIKWEHTFEKIFMQILKILFAKVNSNKIYITVDGTFLAIRDKKTDTYLAIDAGVPRIDLKTLNGIKRYKLTEI